MSAIEDVATVLAAGSAALLEVTDVHVLVHERAAGALDGRQVSSGAEERYPAARGDPEHDDGSCYTPVRDGPDPGAHARARLRLPPGSGSRSPRTHCLHGGTVDAGTDRIPETAAGGE
jgi:hypothetical protein